jgi:predicted ChrR family anti-sigma factor
MLTTPVTDDLQPDFAVDALAEADPASRRQLMEVVHRLPEALPVEGGPASVRARLLTETALAPERYAPFARSLSELFDLPRAEVSDLLERSAQPGAWKMSGLPGIRKLPVRAGASCEGAQTYLVRFAAGVRFPAHRHQGLETVLILAGSYQESTGRVWSTGDYHVMEPGTAHSFTIEKDEDCVAATVLRGGLNFHSLPLRLLARVLGH